MPPNPIQKIVIVGGGTAGWMAAAAMSERFKSLPVTINLIESDDIGTVGVGEATVPGIRFFNGQLNIPELDFIKATQATFKLGIEFKDWYTKGHAFFHPFADYGAPIAGRDFYQCWLKLHKAGYQAPLEDFCLSTQMAMQNRFAQPDGESAPQLARYNYAYHFDATLYGQFLRRYAEARGVLRIEGRVMSVNTRADGFIESVIVDKAGIVSGDFFVDCTGFRALLIEQTLKSGYDNWSHWLPCDSAAAMQTANAESPAPYTRSTALEAGWQWKIPLQHRAGNGYVFCSKFVSDEDAKARLTANVTGEAITEPRIIKFTAGMRPNFWIKNCTALGLASGFLEPLESTSISLIQTGIHKILQFLPDLRLDEAQIAEANRCNRQEYERIRDFIILHYKASQRRDTPFWQQVGAMGIPDTLAQKLEAFQRDGSLLNFELESFQNASWLSMYNGFNIRPDSYSQSVANLELAPLQRAAEKMRSAIAAGVGYAPYHEQFLADMG